MAKLEYNKYYFETTDPHIYGNNELREPQIQGYYKVYEHFIVRNKKNTHAIVVLPTGVGKTGLMGLLPFHICEGRALIITPQLRNCPEIISTSCAGFFFESAAQKTGA